MWGAIAKGIAWLLGKIPKGKVPKKIPKDKKQKEPKKCTTGCDEKNPYKKRTKEQNQKAAESEKELIKEHQEKLERYSKDPYSMDNDGRLKNAPTQAIRDRIIEGRKKVLRDAVTRHQNELKKITEALSSQ